jgi:predicted nucleic acid-binding protein
MFLDAAYVTKYYVNEHDSSLVRSLIQTADSLVCSAWSVVEVTSAVRRHVREGKLTNAQSDRTLARFRRDVETDVWTLIPVSEDLLWRVSVRVGTIPAGVFLRAGDAVQLASAADAGEREIWSNDRHLLAAAPHFGLLGRSA